MIACLLNLLSLLLICALLASFHPIVCRKIYFVFISTLSMSLEEPVSSDSFTPGSIQGLGSYELLQKEREDVCQKVIHEFVSAGVGKQLRIIVIGEAGQGKSTLINALVGKEVAKEGDDFEAGTLSSQQYTINENGVNIEIWDTPGLGLESKEEDEKLVEKLKISLGCHIPDLVLFCIRMDQQRIPTRIHKDMIIKHTEVFGDEFWKHALFILTFANNVTQFCPEGIEIELFFSQRCERIEEQLKNTLEKHSRLSAKEIAEIQVVPVGSCKKGMYSQNPWALPDREDWFIFFWIDVTSRMPSAALSAILQVNHHRLADDAHISLSKAEVELYQRVLQASPEEMETVEKDISAVQSVTNTSDHGELPSAGQTDSNPPPHAKQRAFATEEKNKPIHDRKIPIHIILLKQLKRDNSGFGTYLRMFASKRGEELKVIGHVAGFFEGMIFYLRRRS